MRKTLLILLGILCCLVVTAGRAGMGESRVPEASATLTIDRASADEWLCERTHNSDLNLPRTGGEVSAPVAAPVSLRTVVSESGRVHARFLAALHDAPAQETTLHSSKPFDPSAGPHAVDHYVYRLRRLII